MRIDVAFASPALVGMARSDTFARAVRVLGEAAIFVNREHLLLYPSTPPLYSAGVVYQNEPTNRPDKLLDIPAILSQGWGDCLHLSCWRVAELRERERELNASLAYNWKAAHINGRAGRMFHCFVRRGNGKIEDPSVILGMKV